MARQTMTERRIQRIYNAHLNGVPIPIMLLPRIYKAAETAIKLGLDDSAIGAAMVEASGTKGR